MRSGFLIFGLVVALLFALYAYYRFNHILSNYDLSEKNRKILRIAITIIFFLFSIDFTSFTGILIICTIISLTIVDLFGLIYDFIIRNSENKTLLRISKLRKQGIIALILLLVLMVSGVYGINHIEPTEYNITTDKINGSYTIVFISDTHYNTNQNPELLKNEIKNINGYQPDLVILGGDIIDDRTPPESVKEVFKELGGINSTYGTYFVFGNHDRTGKLTDGENLTALIEKCGITILADENKTFNDDLILIGRNDNMFSNDTSRMTSQELLDNIDKSKYILLIDHQPKDSEINSRLGVDLELSGHTHGGQIFPMNVINNIIGTLNYGPYHFGDMTHIVSSGIAGWGWPLKNVGKAEYVIININ